MDNMDKISALHDKQEKKRLKNAKSHNYCTYVSRSGASAGYQCCGWNGPNLRGVAHRVSRHNAHINRRNRKIITSKLGEDIAKELIPIRIHR